MAIADTFTVQIRPMNSPWKQYPHWYPKFKWTAWKESTGDISGGQIVQTATLYIASLLTGAEFFTMNDVWLITDDTAAGRYPLLQIVADSWMDGVGMSYTKEPSPAVYQCGSGGDGTTQWGMDARYRNRMGVFLGRPAPGASKGQFTLTWANTNGKKSAALVKGFVFHDEPLLSFEQMPAC